MQTELEQKPKQIRPFDVLEVYTSFLELCYICIVPTHFKLEPLLRRHNKSVLALVKASGLAKTTVYNLVNNRAKAVELETLSKLIDGLERLTDKTISFDDVLEKEPRERNALLDDLLKDAKPLDWDKMMTGIPDWTEEEREENSRVFEMERERKNAKRPSKRLEQMLEIFGSGEASTEMPAETSTETSTEKLTVTKP